MKPISALFLFAVIGAGTACTAALPPPELVSARTGYARAEKGQAATLNPTDLHTAKLALDAAEREFSRDGDTQATRDLGYAAERRAEIAESRARTMAATTDKDGIVAQMNATTSSDLVAANQKVAAQGDALKTQGAALTSETQRRQDAEKRAAQSAADLAKLGSVKQEPRGMVLTLSGGVLFATNKFELLPAAQVKLNDVAKALIEQDPDSTMVVEGYTDSQGIDSANQELSQKRAQAVRDYLVSRGVASDRIAATGFGPAKPVADNKSVEGRANNRRVEIVVKPKS